jgi:ABC-2 type transport system permease protein
MNFLHVFGIFYRNVILIRRSVPKLFALFGFITVELFLWGFITLWVQTIGPNDARLDFILLILSAFIFWSMFELSQRSFSVSFLEEVWSRNVINIFASPVKLSELVMGFALVGVVQTLLAFCYITPIALLLYALNIWDMGPYTIPFFVNVLITGWGIGVVAIGLVVRFGPSADILAFFIPFLLLPFSAVYYPITVFPSVLQKITFILPTRHIFEGMRTVITEGLIPYDSIVWATALNIVYVVLGFLFLHGMLRLARARGYLSRLVQD